ncbi:MAG: hypothetical protein H8E12_08950 [Rhodobacteraceae bacterium]|nr:hypothetical protein [Paracoccaceae bacterium]
MRIEDVMELIQVDMPDLTEGPFSVDTNSDDGGSHIVVSIEHHENGQHILRLLSQRFKDNRIIVLLVPKGNLHQ